MARSPTRVKTASTADAIKDYRHVQDAAARPEAGAERRFKKRLPTATYRYDSSLSPALDWDTNPARDTAAWLLQAIEDAAPLPGQVFPQPRKLLGADGRTLMQVVGLQDALAALKRMQAPFLDWAGKAERGAFAVPTLPLFVHERLSTEATVRTLGDHRRRAPDNAQYSMFADPQMPMSHQVDAYAHRNRWVNRMILGDSLQVMNSLARYEALAGTVQCIYMDPPYGVKFGSNFQPFVRKREVKHNDDADMTREPEMVQAYRDTWQLGLHSYLTYLRDRLVAARELLTPSGSVFVQISDDNLHHVRELMNEVFGEQNRVGLIAFKKTGFSSDEQLPSTHDYIIWFAKDRLAFKPKKIFAERDFTVEEITYYDHLETPDGRRRSFTPEERKTPELAMSSGRPYARNPMVSPGWQESLAFPVTFDNKGL